MLFKTETVSATWDTWMYHHDGRFYLYYLITESSPGEGFGVAVSEDGVHWEDHGLAIQASDQMVFFLGTGAVWKSPDFDTDKKFICNYSEWRVDQDGKRAQQILFAWSYDLIHWEKFGDAYAFPIDVSKYAYAEDEGARWDCIYPLQKEDGSYYGYWTAKPKDFIGFGFGESEDGIHWKALEPPLIEWGEIPVFSVIEAGAIHRFGDRYYCMAGNYQTPNGMFTFVADKPSGPFRPAVRNFKLLYNQSFTHVYFSRFLDTPSCVLVNHHSLLHETNAHGRPITYLAPLKKATVENDTLQLMWWEGNEALKGDLLWDHTEPTIGFDVHRGIVLEGTLVLPGSIFIEGEGDEPTEIRVDQKGISEAGRLKSGTSDFLCDEKVDRDIPFPGTVNFRLLLRGTLLEFYMEDVLVICYTLSEKPSGRISFHHITESRAWNWNL